MATDSSVQLWQARLSAATALANDVDLFALAQRYPLSAQAIARAARMERTTCVADPGCELTMARLEHAARTQLEGDASSERRTLPPTNVSKLWL